MPELLDLPNEILDKIVDQIHPDDIINFSLSRLRIYRVARDAVSLHLERKTTYEDVVLHGCHRHADNAHPLRLIQDICTDWRIGEYPKVLMIECCHHPLGPDFVPEDQHDEKDTRMYEAEKREDDIINDTTMQVIQGDIEDKYVELGFPYPTHFDVDIMCIEAVRGERSAMLGLLLLFVPNLEELCLDRFTLSALYLHPAVGPMSELNVRRSPGARKPLMKLSVITFLGSDNNVWGGENFEAFGWFSALPSLRQIKGRFVEGHDEPLTNWTDTSNVTEILLRQSAVYAKNVAQLLIGIKALTHFTYEYKQGWNQRMEACKIVAALHQYAKHSLEYLSLTGSYEGNDDMKNPCLQGFEVLKQFYLQGDIYTELLSYRDLSPGRGSDRKEIQPLVYVMPASIERIGIFQDGVSGHTSDLLVDFAEEKDLRLPKLNKVMILDFGTNLIEDGGEAMRGICEKVGVSLETEWEGGY